MTSGSVVAGVEGKAAFVMRTPAEVYRPMRSPFLRWY
jgi:hypothetical protein